MKILDHPGQRHTEKRVEEKKYHKKMQVRTPDHIEIPVCECACDIPHPTIANLVFKKGTEVLADAHTRRLWWQKYPTPTNPKPEVLNKKTIMVSSYEEMLKVFNWFNSPDDVKKANDRIFGAARAMLLPRGLSLFAPQLLMVQPWEYAAAGINPTVWTRGAQSTLSEACKIVEEVYPAAMWFQDEVLDNLGTNVNISSPILACVLMSWFKHRDNEKSLERLRDWTVNVSKDAINKSQSPYECDTIFLEHWHTKGKRDKSQYIGSGILNRGEESTRMQGFILLMIDKYVSDVRHKNVPNTWSAYYSTWQKEYAMMNSNQSVIELLNNIE
jgi:hypothetical protein